MGWRLFYVLRFMLYVSKVAPTKAPVLYFRNRALRPLVSVGGLPFGSCMERSV
jgi:hypothetical protein